MATTVTYGSQIDIAITNFISAEKLSSNYFIAAFNTYSSGNYITKAALVDYNGNVYTYSNEIVSNYGMALTTSAISICVISPTKIVIVYAKYYYDYDYPYWLGSYAKIGTISGATITFGQEYLVESRQSGQYTIGATVINSTTILAVTSNIDVDGSYTHVAKTLITVSDSSLSSTLADYQYYWDGGGGSNPYNFQFENVGSFKVCSFSFKYPWESYTRTIFWLRNITTGIEYGFAVPPNSSEGYMSNIEIKAIDTNKFIVGCMDNSNITRLHIGTITGTSVTYSGTTDLQPWSQTDYPYEFSINVFSSTKAVIIYQGQVSGGQYLFSKILNTDGTNITLEDRVNIKQTGAGYTNFSKSINKTATTFSYLWPVGFNEVLINGSIPILGKKINGITCTKWNGIAISKFNGI